MANPNAKNLHLSPDTGVYQRCVANKACPFVAEEGNASHSDLHLSLVEIAQNGGGDVRLDGHSKVLEVSPVDGLVFTVGGPDGGRKRTYTVAGEKITYAQALKLKTGKTEIYPIEAHGGRVLRTVTTSAD